MEQLQDIFGKGFLDPAKGKSQGEEIRLDRDKDGLEDFCSCTSGLDTRLDAFSNCGWGD